MAQLRPTKLSGLAVLCAGANCMEASHHLILAFGAIGVVGLLSGLLLARFGAPILLVFLGLGMFAGQFGPVRLDAEDIGPAYLIGCLALTMILLDAGLKTRRRHLVEVLAPALALATLGVVLTAAIVGVSLLLMLSGRQFSGNDLVLALLIGAIVAPTDATAIASVLRRLPIALPHRIATLLEVESGLNDPVSIFLTLMLTRWLVAPQEVTGWQLLWELLCQLAGGALGGLVGGNLLLLAMRHLRVEPSLYPVLLTMGVLSLFGAIQVAGASGFMAVYLAGVVVGNGNPRFARMLDQFFGAATWLAQVALFVMLGMLVSPDALLAMHGSVLVVVAALVFVARPLACLVCLTPLRYPPRETMFIAWVGLRGGVPIFLTFVPLLAGVREAPILFTLAFVTVVVSLVLQAWTIAPLARSLGPWGVH
jgi:NhaP-type Na+/H+ and K+/H+ antiporter